MKKAKRTFATTQKADKMLGKFDFSHKGFAVVHEERIVYILESTDAEIRKGNEALQNKFLELVNRYPNYSFSVLHIVFLGEVA